MTDLRNPFPGVPFVESPIFDSVVDQMPLAENERTVARDLNRRGYAIFDFPDPAIDSRIERIRERLAGEFEVVGRIQDAWQYDEDIRAIAANEAVIDLLSKLWGRRAFPFQTLNFPVGTQQHVHTDTVHFSSMPERFMCAVWVAMEDVHPDAGPLHYVPGSHKWPIVNNAMIGRRGWQEELEFAQVPYHDAWSALMAEHQVPLETFLARKGQALIWCANLLHGGAPQIDSARTRWSQVTHYFFDDCIYYTPALSDEALGRLHLRQIVDAAAGTSKPNLYLGEEIRTEEPVEQMPRRAFWRRALTRSARA